KEGKDSYRLTKAGADVTCLVSADKSVIMENRPRPMEQIFGSVKDVDIILTEGYKTGVWPKIMLYRSDISEDYPIDPEKCLAVVSDTIIPEASLQFSPNDICGMADFLIRKISLQHQQSNPLRNLHFLKNVEEETIRGLWADGKTEDVPRNMILIEMEKRTECIYIQLTGSSCSYHTNVNGHRKVMFIHNTGAILNQSILGNSVPTLTCETLERSRIFVIPLSRFQHWMEKDHKMFYAVFRMQEWKTYRLEKQLDFFTASRLSTERKVAYLLWQLGHDYGQPVQEGLEICLNLSVTFLADILGLPRETTSRAYNNLGKYKLIHMIKKRITIPDPGKLQDFYLNGVLRTDEYCFTEK
ncbi:MAG: molybdopterin-guanine dinucleotide biosynthesis protein MobB, partial [Eubacterium sp.]|nr:molybdopterin-guanine dinucleotide biosynthesis protein MobB [Eubacterium sp.]